MQTHFFTNYKRYLIVFSCLLFSVTANASTSLSKEKMLKAAYLLNFSKYIEWPGTGKNQLVSTISICVDESPEFIEFLRKMIGNKRFGKMQHELKVLSWDTASECELLYVTESKKFGAVVANGVVIVADSEQLNFPGAAITFYEENRKLRFEIDLNSVKALKVTFSSELLKLARIK
ncbi:MAG: hypothetical protein ACI9IA_002023 [Enterobacterales bacterium]|jgi:hypothetical protein